MKHISTLLLFCLFASLGFAQQFRLEGENFIAWRSATLDQHLKEYSVQAIEDINAFNDFLRQQDNNIELTLQLENRKEMTLILSKVNLLSPSYIGTAFKKKGTQAEFIRPTAITLQGKVAGEPESAVAITVSENSFYGLIQKGTKELFIEPANTVSPGYFEGEYLVYEACDVIENPNFVCAFSEFNREKGLIREKVNDLADNGSNCYQVIEVAIASDYSMVLKYGSVQGVLDHNVALMNASALNFDDEFTLPIYFAINAQFVSACLACDPWTYTSDGGVTFGNFANWASNGGFGPNVTYDLAHFRTANNLYYGGNQVAGLSALDQFCNINAINVFSETSLHQFCNYRKTTSHEIGHSFGSLHTTTGIMLSGTSCVNFWQQSTIDEINIKAPSIACIACENCIDCQPVVPFGPGSLGTLCGSAQKCVNFNSNPCNHHYEVSSSDVNLQVSTSGTTICLTNLSPIPRTAYITVTAYNGCGEASFAQALWTININAPEACDRKSFSEGGGEVSLADSGNQLQFSQNGEVLTLRDNALETRSKLVQIYDFNGKILREEVCDGSINPISLDGLPKGMLISRAIHGAEVVTTKFYNW